MKLKLLVESVQIVRNMNHKHIKNIIYFVRNVKFLLNLIFIEDVQNFNHLTFLIGNLINKKNLSQLEKHLLLDQGRLSTLFAQDTRAESKEIVRLLKDILDECQRDEFGRMINIEITSLSVLAAVTGEIPQQNQSFYLKILGLDERDWIATIYATLMLPVDTYSDSVANRFFDYLDQFQKANNGLYSVLLPTISSTIMKKTAKIAFDRFGLNFLGINYDLCAQDLQSFPIDSVTNATFPCFLNLLCLQRNSSAIFLLESVLWTREMSPPEPGKAKTYLFETSNEFVLLNTSITSNKHFLLKLAREYTERLLNDQLSSIKPEFPDLLPLVFLSIFENIRSKHLLFEKLCPDVAKFANSPILKEIFSRLISDSQLLNFLFHFSNERPSYPDLRQHSIPFFIHKEGSLDYVRLGSIKDVKCYLYTDESLNKDIEFIRCYKTLHKSICYLTHGTSKKLHLKKIQNIELRKIIACEMYSMIFLQDNDENFIVAVDRLKEYLQIIHKFFDPNGMITKAISRIHYGIITNCKSIKDLLQPDSVVLGALMDNKLYDDAVLFTSNPNVLIAKAILQDADLENITFKIERFLSTGVEPLFDIPSDVGQNELIVIENRRENPSPFQFILCESFNEVMKMTSMINNYCFRIHSHLDGAEFYEFQLFSTFCELLNLIYSLWIDDSKEPTAATLVSQLIERDTFESLSLRSIEFLLLYASALDIKTKLFDFISKQSKTTAYAIFYTKLVGGKMDKNGLRKALKRLGEGKALKKRHSFSFKDLRLSGSDIDLESISEEVQHESIFIKYLVSLLEDVIYDVFEDEDKEEISEDAAIYRLKNLMERKPLPIEEINDLSFRMPFDTFINIFKEKISDFFIEELNQLVPFNSTFESLHHLLDLQFGKFDPQVIFTTLIENYNFKVLYKVIHEFEFVDYGFTILDSMIEKDPFIVNHIHLQIPTLIFELEKGMGKKYQIYESQQKEEIPSQFIDMLEDDQMDLRILYLTLSEIRYSFEINEKMLGLLLTKSINIISFTFIDSAKKEMKIAFYLHMISKMLANIKSGVQCFDSVVAKDVGFPKIDIVSTLVSRYLYSRFNYIVDLVDFVSPEKGADFAALCLRLDSPQLMYDFCNVWNVDVAPFLIERAIFPFRVGLIQTGINYMENLSPKEQRAKQSINEGIETLVCVMTHTLLFDFEFLEEKEKSFDEQDISKEGSIEFDFGLNVPETSTEDVFGDYLGQIIGHRISIDDVSLYHRWEKASHGEMVVLNGSSQIKALKKVLLLIHRKERLIQFYSHWGWFDDAISIWSTTKPRQQDEIFIKSIVCPSLANWNTFWRRILKEEEEMKRPIEVLFGFLKANKMGESLNDIQTRLKMHESVVSTILFSFDCVASWDKRLKLVRLMNSATQAAIQGKNRKDEKIYSTEQLYAIKDLSVLQEKLILFCQQHQIPFDPSLEVFHDKDHQMKVAILMMNKGEYEYVLDLIQYTTFSFCDVCILLIDELLTSGMPALTAFFTKLTRAPKTIYKIIAENMVDAIAGRVKDGNQFFVLIEANVKDELVKGILYNKYGFLDAAFKIAKKKNDIILMKSVLHSAEVAKNEKMVKKCQKFLR